MLVCSFFVLRCNQNSNAESNDFFTSWLLDFAKSWPTLLWHLYTCMYRYTLSQMMAKMWQLNLDLFSINTWVLRFLRNSWMLDIRVCCPYSICINISQILLYFYVSSTKPFLCYLILQNLAKISQAIFLQQILQNLQNPTTASNKSYLVYYWAAGLCGSMSLIWLLWHHTFLAAERLGVNMRSAAMSLVYKKVQFDICPVDRFIIFVFYP